MRDADRTPFVPETISARVMIAAALACLALACGPAAAQRAAPRTCSAEIGPKAAGLLVDQCRQVSLASRPPCNADNSCRLIRDEVRRGCALLGAEAPALCRSYVDVPEEDEDEDE